MGKASVEIKEIRFIIEPELTQCYILMQGHGDCPAFGVTGWHHKTFPKSMSVMDIVKTYPKDDAVLWGMEAPE